MADDFNFDDLNWDDFNVDEPEDQNNDRNPVVKVAKQVGRGTKKIVFDRSRVRKTVTQTLPGAHSNVAEAGFELGDVVQDIYRNLENEASKTKTDTQKSLRRFNSQTKGMFGDKVEGFLKKLAGEENPYSNNKSEDERRREEISATTAEIFGAMEERTTEIREQNEAKALRQEVISKRRFRSTIGALNSMAGNLDTLAKGTTTDLRFKRKTLELQMQNNMLLGDMLRGIGELRTDMLSELKAVVKNTGLPEAAKIQLSEEFKRVNQQRMMEAVGGSVFGGLTDYLTRTGKGINRRMLNTIGNKMRDVRSNLSGGIEAAGEMLAMQREAQRDGQDDTIETLVELAGGMMADRAVGKWGGAVKDRLGKFKWFDKSKGRADNYSTQGARMLNWQAAQRNTHDGLKGEALDFFRSLLDRTTLNAGLGGIVGGDTNAYDEVKMRRLSTKTIVTIIPGLLARIHHEAVKARTGDDSVPMIKYNLETGTFTDSNTMLKAAREKLVAPGAAKDNTEAMNRIIKDTVDTSNLTGGQLKVLRNHFAHLQMRQLPFDPRSIATGKMPIFGEGSAKDKEAVKAAITAHYGVNAKGEVEGSLDDYEGRVAGSARAIHSMRHTLSDPRRLVTEMIEQGRIEELVEMGALVERNGQMMIDFDAINEMRFNDEAGKSKGANPAFSPKGFRALSAGGPVTNNVVNNRNTLNRMAGSWNKEDRYNSQYQSLAMEEIMDKMDGGRYSQDYAGAALEEIIDVLQRGQQLSTQQFETLNSSVRNLCECGKDGEETYNSQYQTLVLEEIMDILQDGRQFTNMAGAEGEAGLMERARNRVRKGFDSLRGKGGNLLKMAGDLKSKIMGRFKRNRDSVAGMVNRARDRITTAWSDVRDWYREGEWRPALEARKLAAKKYIDSATNTVVTKLSKVKGDIYELMEDGSTQLALTYDDLRAGIRDGKGKRFVMDKLSSARDMAGGLLNKALGRHRDMKDAMMGRVKDAAGWAKSMIFGIPDVYVVGESKPRLLAAIAKSGGYLSVGGGKVRTLKDLDGPVADLLGNVVLSEDDIAKGLVDVDGKNLTRFSPGLSRLMNRLKGFKANPMGGLNRMVRKAKVGAKRIKRRIGRIFTGMGNMLKDFTGGIMGKFRSVLNGLGSGATTEEEHLDVAYAQLEVQGLILDQLIARQRKGKRGKWDSNGDGTIDGSWRDLLSRRAAKKSGEEGEKEKKPSKVMNFLKDNFLKIGTMFMGAAAFIGKKFSDGISWLGKILMARKGAEALGDIMGGRGGRRGGGRAPRGGRRMAGGGRFGRLAGMLGGMGMGGLGFAGDFGGGGSSPGDYAMDAVDMASTASEMPGTKNTAGKVAAKVAGRGLLARGAGMLGAAALGVGRLAMGPWGWAATAAYYGGKYLYNKWDSSKPRPLQAIRLAQYGVDRDKGDAAGRYLEFEQWVIDNSKATGKGAATLQGVEQEDILNAMEETIGGVADDPDRALRWFSYRFMPVYASWTSALAAGGRSAKLSELDDTLTAIQAAEVYEKVKSAPASTRAIALPNPNDPTMGAREVADKIAALGATITGKTAGVKEGDTSAKALTVAAATSGLASMSGQESVVPGAIGRGLGFAAEAIPGLKAGIAGINSFTAVAKQLMSKGDPSGGYDELKVTKGPLDPLRSVRMKVYGLKELNLPLVNAILRLECDLQSGVSYSGKSSAVYRGDIVGATDNAMASFGVNKDDPEARNQFVNWVNYRFLPAYQAYLGAAHEAGIQSPLRAHLQGSLTQQYYAANAMVGASAYYKNNAISVFRTMLHPIYGEAPNDNPASVKGNMETLLAGVKEGELSEISGEKGGVLGKAEKLIDRITNKVTDIKNTLIQKATGWMPEGMGNKIRSFFGADGPGYSSSPAPQTPVSPVNTPGGSYTPMIGGGSDVNFDPAGGKNGNVNDIPLPTGPKGFEAHMQLIASVSKMTGVDPGILAGLFATESSFDSSAKPGTSSAKGLGQFINSTWESMVKNYGHLFGIKPGTSPNDPRANALMSVMYMKENAEYIKNKMGKSNVTDVDLYLAHFLGAGGYGKLYKNPNGIAAQLLPDAARSNASIFYRNGDRSQPRTAAEVMAIQANKQIKNRNHYGPLMHAFVKQQGGTVDSSIFNDDGSQTIAATSTGPSAPSSSPADPAGSTPDSGVKPASLDVDGGGMPMLPSGVGPAAGLRTAASVGGDISKPPSAASVASDPAKAVSQEVAANTGRRQQEVAANQDYFKESTGNELVVVSKESRDLLRELVEVAKTIASRPGQPGGAPSAPGSGGPGVVNGLPAGPVSVKRQSSV